MPILLIATNEKQPVAWGGAPKVAMSRVIEDAVDAVVTGRRQPAFDRTVYLARGDLRPLRNPEHRPAGVASYRLAQDRLKA